MRLRAGAVPPARLTLYGPATRVYTPCTALGDKGSAMRTRPSLLVAVALAAALTTTLSGPGHAAAARADEPVSDTGYQPAQDLPPVTFRACGTRVTLDEVLSLFEVKERLREYADGSTLIDGFGRNVLRVTTADGRRARLDASGPYRVRIDPVAGRVVFRGRGATVLYPGNPLQAAAARAAGLPRFSTFTGDVVLVDRFDPETGEPTSARVVERPEFVTNACLLLHR